MTRQPSKKWLVFGILFGLALLAVPAYRYVRQPRYDGTAHSDVAVAVSRLDDDIKAAERAGVPLILSDLDRDPPVTETDNAASAFLAATDSALIDKGVYDALHFVQDSIAAQDYESAGRVLDSVAPQLKLAMMAANLPSCDFKRDWDQGFQLTFPELARSKVVVRLIVSRAVVHASKSDHDAAIADLRAALKFAHHSGSDPALIPLLLEIALQQSILRSVECCLSLAKTEQAIAKYPEFLKTRRQPHNLRRVMKGESYVTLATIRNLTVIDAWEKSGKDKVDPSKLIRSGIPEGRDHRAFMARHLETWTGIFLDSRNLSDDSVVIFDAVDRYTPSEKPNPHTPSYALQRMLMPVYKDTGDAIRGGDARWQAVVALATVLQHKAKTGAFPNSLAEVGFVEKDPFARGKPYTYIRGVKSFKVYSLGKDRVDNEGRRLEEMPSGSKEFDIAASYPPLQGSESRLKTESEVRSELPSGNSPSGNG